MVVMVVHLDGAVAAGIGRRGGLDDDGFPGLGEVSDVKSLGYRYTYRHVQR